MDNQSKKLLLIEYLFRLFLGVRGTYMNVYKSPVPLCRDGYTALTELRRLIKDEEPLEDEAYYQEVLDYVS
jgi:hypothetical protein